MEVAVWQAVKKSLGRQEFVTRHPYPFLLKRQPTPSQTSIKVPENLDDFDGERPSFHTDVVDVGTVKPPAPHKLAGATVLPVVKKPTNPFPDRISVGRATNCDVVIRDNSVSKLHGHFVVTAEHTEFVDLKSANGTKINGKLVPKRTAVRCSSGDTIVFGGVAVQFLDAKALWELL